MGDHLKLCSGSEAVRKFQKAGWSVSRQKGSHVNDDKYRLPMDLSHSPTQRTWTRTAPQIDPPGRSDNRQIQ